MINTESTKGLPARGWTSLTCLLVGQQVSKEMAVSFFSSTQEKKKSLDSHLHSQRSKREQALIQMYSMKSKWRKNASAHSQFSHAVQH